jgi:hypothetical protein
MKPEIKLNFSPSETHRFLVAGTKKVSGKKHIKRDTATKEHGRSSWVNFVLVTSHLLVGFSGF